MTTPTNAMAAPRRIGILGGMGPAAAIDLQARILEATPATEDGGHLPVVVWNVPQVPDRVAAVRGMGPSPLPAMVAGARALEAAGCEAFAIACHTAHHWAQALEAAVSIPLIHIGEAAAAALARRSPRPGRVGLLATRGTLDSGFLGHCLAANGFDWTAPGDPIQSRWVDTAIARVKAGDLDGARTAFAGAAEAFAARGPDVLLLACTELPLAARGTEVCVPVVDATRALADAVVDFALRR